MSYRHKLSASAPLRVRWLSDVSDTEAYIALAGTLLGGAGLKVVEALLGRAKSKEDAGAALRTELRLELGTLRTEMERLRSETIRLDGEIDKWRTRYYALLAAVATKDQGYLDKVLQERIE